VLVERHAELLGALPHFVPVHAPREGLVLELFLDRRHLEVREALRRPHQRARHQEPAQLVDCEQGLGHQGVAAYPV